MRHGRRSQPQAFSDEVRKELVDRGLINSIEAPHGDVEAVLARLYGYRLQTFRSRRKEITTAQLLTLIGAVARRADR